MSCQRRSPATLFLTHTRTHNSCREMEFDAVLLAVPAKQALSLLEGAKGQKWEDHAVDVVRRCAGDYVRRYSALIGLKRGGKACTGMLARFREIFCESEGTHDGRIGGDAEMAIELDTEAAVQGGCVCLLSLCRGGGADEVCCEEGEQESASSSATSEASFEGGRCLYRKKR